MYWNVADHNAVLNTRDKNYFSRTFTLCTNSEMMIGSFVKHLMTNVKSITQQVRKKKNLSFIEVSFVQPLPCDRPRKLTFEYNTDSY